MAEYVAFSPSVEVNGQTIFSTVDGLKDNREDAMDYLFDEGIIDPRPGNWYSQQAWLNVLRKIRDRFGPDYLFFVGGAIPLNASFPPNIKTVTEGLRAINAAYHMNHRGGEVGYYRFEIIDANNGRMVCNNPYPNDFNRGLIFAIAKMYAKNKDSVEVALDHQEVSEMVDEESCTFRVHW